MSRLSALLRGETAAFDQILHNCRFEGFGAGAVGREAIEALFRAHPASGEGLDLMCSGLSAFVGSDTALFADVFDGWITRLWRLDAGAVEPAAPATAVPVDLDRDQRGGRLAFDPADHAGLAPTDAAGVQELGEAWLRDAPPAVVGPLSRPRPLVVRALSDGTAAAALFRIDGTRHGGMAGFYVAAAFTGAGPQVVVDQSGRAAALAAPWLVNLRPEATA